MTSAATAASLALDTWVDGRSLSLPDHLTILLVDDDPADLALLQTMLEQGNSKRLDIAQAGTAKTAIAACRMKSFDCVVVDQHLPDATGIELIGRLRDASADYFLPVVLVTGKGDEMLAVASLQRGASDYLPKDRITRSAIWRAVTNAVQKAAMHRFMTSDREALEEINAELVARNHEIHSLYHTVSHELKTPLLAAREFVALTRDGVAGELNDTQREYLGIAMECCDRLAFYVNNLLDTVRSETGKLELALDTCDPRQLLADAVVSMRPLCEKAGIDCRLDVAGEIPEGQLDGARVTQILYNLLSNAIKFTPEGGTIRASVASPSAGWVRFAVADTGCGIDAAQLEQVFERFYQADNQSAARSSGIGIGLSVCRSIARQHGGDITVTSNPGEGATFNVDLPVRIKEEVK